MANLNFTAFYNSINESVPEKYKPFIILATFTIFIAIYAIFVWKFYRFLAKRDILELNLSQYNRSEHAFWSKFIAGFLFFIEYIIIVPVLVFFWFSILAIFFILVSKADSASHILIVAAAIVAAVRLTSYYSTDLSKDLAKLFPFTVLGVFLIEPGFFSIQKLILRIAEIPSLFYNILSYLVFIIIIEIVMRFFFLIFGFDSSDKNGE